MTAREFRYSTPLLERNLLLIYDVVIAAGGPVGLFLACELRLTGLWLGVLGCTRRGRFCAETLAHRHPPYTSFR